MLSYRNQLTHMCCSALQCVAVCRSAVQCVAVCRSAVQCVAVCRSAVQCVAVCCSVLQCVAVCCSVLQCVAVWCTQAILHKSAITPHTRARANTRSSRAQPMLEPVLTPHLSIQNHHTPATLRMQKEPLPSILAVCCSVLQCVAVCCSVLQCVAVCCSVVHLGRIAGLS